LKGSRPKQCIAIDLRVVLIFYHQSFVCAAPTMTSKPNAVLVDGKLISGQDLRDYATRLGLCQMCAQHKTHKKAGSILNRSWEPITAIDEQGMYTIYKGYCLQPTCYTFGKAQELLGERTTRPRIRRRKGHNSRRIVVTKSTSSLMASTVTAATTTDVSSSFFKTRPASYSTPADFQLTGSIRTIAHEGLPKERSSPTWDASVSPKTPIRSPKTILKPPPSSPTTFVLQQLEDTKERADCTTILNIMYGCCHDPEVAHKALTYLRQTIVQSHKETKIDSVFSNSSWARIVGSTMKFHESRVNVVSEGVLLWITLCALSPVYKQDIQREGCIGVLISILQLHAANLELQERCCAALMECSTFSFDDLLSTESQVLEELVKALVLKLTSPSDYCRECAVVSLFRLSRSHGHTLPTEGDDVWEQIHKTLVSQDGVGHLWELLQRDMTLEQAKEGAAHLLWRLVASANEKSPGMSSGRVNPTEANVGSVVKLLQGSGSTFLMESACGLLASMSSDDIVSNCADVTHAIFQAVFEALNKFPMSQGIHTHGFNILRDMLSLDSPEVLEERDQGYLAAIVLRAMHRFPECAEVQDAGCQVVAYACDRYEGARQVAASSGTTVILRAFQRSVTRDRLTSDSGDRCTYLAAISSLGRLSSATGAAMLVLSKSRIVLDLELAMENEEDPHVLESLLRIVLNLLPSMICEQEGAGDERAGDSVTSNLIYHVLNAMESADSADFKRVSCTLLALLYSKIPLTSFNQHSSVVSVGLYKMAVQRYHRREWEAIEKIMRTHLDNNAVQEAGCVSLSNFWSAVASNRGVESREFGSSEIVTQLASSGLDLILDVMRHHKSDMGLQIKAVRLFWALTIVCETKQRKKREAQLVEQILDSLDSVGDNMELLSETGDILKCLALQKNSLPLLGSSSVISILIRMLHVGNDYVVTRSSQVLDMLLNNRFDASRILAENENGIAKIKLCMAKYPSLEELQQRLCSVVESLVVLVDNRFISELTDSVCLKALTDALTLYPNNERLVESACRAIVGLLADIESSVLWTARITLSEAVMGSLDGTLQCPDAQKAAVDILYTLCVKEDGFKLLVAGSIPSLLRSLNAYPSKADLHKNGCAIIRLVAGSGENMDIVGRKDTVGCIVNSMLIHPESTSLVMECLATVHYLAAEDSTRKTLRHCEVEDACICLLRINLRNDKIVGAVLAALNNIAVDAKSRSVSPMKSGVLDVLLMAMARYPESNSVQTQGCLLLKNYTYEHASFQAMKNQADDLVSLLVVSAEINPKECGDRAHYIIQKLLEK
jgi:hypothetical protein